MKTLNQIAKENKASKQQVYRIYKSEIEALHKAHQILLHQNQLQLKEKESEIIESDQVKKSIWNRIFG